VSSINLSMDGMVAVVTGASRGIGEAIARAFARRGTTVVIAARKLDALETVAASIGADGPGKAIPAACHTGRPGEIAALFERVRSELGRLDVLVNNAATNPYLGPALDCTEAAFDKTFEVNVKGYFLMCQHAARMMVEQRSGSIINIASIAGITPLPMQLAYSMTKAAVLSLTRELAKELGRTGVRVNAIAPGVIETRFAAALIEDPEVHRRIVQLTPLARHGQPDEVVGAALYLASDAASFTTGSVLVCDGGMTA
jgi:NAD(P)-dependent dehydrogenase (short-subunit alcohol dehydrogenase family)